MSDIRICFRYSDFIRQGGKGDTKQIELEKLSGQAQKKNCQKACFRKALQVCHGGFIFSDYCVWH